jgi:hypothetical protein
LKKYVDAGQIEYHGWTSMTEFPSLLNKVSANLMYAPLMDNDFNRSKANIKLTEAGALKMPCVAQDIDCYNRDGYPFLFKTGQEMFDQFEAILKDEQSFRQAVEDVSEYTDKYWLGSHLNEWTNIYTTSYGDPKRKEQTAFYERNKQQFE